VTVASNRWFIRPPVEDATARLFCLPYSGVGASMYAGWPDRAGSVEIVPIQLPGRENRLRDEHFGGYDELAADLVDGIGDRLDRPFGFFGHCGGALAAFAAVRELDRRGGPAAACLFVSSQVAPHEGPYGRFLSMSDDELRVELERLTVALGGEPRADTIELGLDTLRPDVAANRAYRLDAPVALSCGLYAVGWRSDGEIEPERMAGWAAYVPPDRYRRVVLDGTHHEFLRAPRALLDTFRRGFARVGRVAETDPGGPA
jgi:surfactin synthase thioesterase subunit